MSQFRKPTREELEHRFKHHAPHSDQVSRYTQIRGGCLILATLIVDNTPCSPEQARSLNALDEVMMLANASIARHEPVPA